MGGKCPHRKVKKRRYSHKTSRRTKFEIKDILSVVFSLFFFPRFLAVSRGFFVDYMVNFLDYESVDHVTMLFMRAFRRQMRRRSRCLSMKIFLGWASITACTASKLSRSCLLGYIYIYIINRFGFCVLFCNWFEFFVFLNLFLIFSISPADTSRAWR